MEYFDEIFDRRTGELIKVSTGDWIPLTELGQLHGVGPKKVRTILREMGVVHVEGAERHQRHRLAAWVVQRGWGRRIERKGTVPFDVVGPELRAWVAERWSETTEKLVRTAGKHVAAAGEALRRFGQTRGKQELSVQQAVCWLRDNFDGLTQTEMAGLLDVTQQLVAKYLNIRDSQLREARELKAMDVDQRRQLRSALWLETPSGP